MKNVCHKAIIDVQINKFTKNLRGFGNLGGLTEIFKRLILIDICFILFTKE